MSRPTDKHFGKFLRSDIEFAKAVASSKYPNCNTLSEEAVDLLEKAQSALADDDQLAAGFYSAAGYTIAQASRWCVALPDVSRKYVSFGRMLSPVGENYRTSKFSRPTEDERWGKLEL